MKIMTEKLILEKIWVDFADVMLITIMKMKIN